MTEMPGRIYLSPPHLGYRERELVADAFASNWIAPLGPHVDAFEREFAEYVRAEHAVALSSGTAALHLALQLAGVGPGDEVLVSTLTFIASVNPIRYLGAEPGFIDIEIRDSGTGVAEDELERIFEHFVSSKPQGLGMGLAISRSIVEAHGGKIWATRNAGPGITLHVRLPLARGGPA